MPHIFIKCNIRINIRIKMLYLFYSLKTTQFFAEKSLIVVWVFLLKKDKSVTQFSASIIDRNKVASPWCKTNSFILSMYSCAVGIDAGIPCVVAVSQTLSLPCGQTRWEQSVSFLNMPFKLIAVVMNQQLI